MQKKISILFIFINVLFEEETDIIRNSIKNVKNKTELIDIFKNLFGN